MLISVRSFKEFRPGKRPRAGLIFGRTYVQFDGVYWHGLDRPIEPIAEYRTKRDVQIHKKWLTDRAQDAWFKANGKCLVRITDKELKIMGDKVLERLK